MFFKMVLDIVTAGTNGTTVANLTATIRNRNGTFPMNYTFVGSPLGFDQFGNSVVLNVTDLVGVHRLMFCNVHSHTDKCPSAFVSVVCSLNNQLQINCICEIYLQYFPFIQLINVILHVLPFWLVLQ